jgi:hypothetical protein
MLIQDAPTPITWGIVKGDLITFKVAMPGPGGTGMVTFVYIGKLENGQIDFGRRPEDLTQGRLVEFMATKAN